MLAARRIDWYPASGEEEPMNVASLIFAATLLAALGCGLIAGVFFAFSAFVMKALARLPAPHGIAAMQSINVVVLNPVFLGAFLGTAALCVGLAISAFATGLDRAALCRILGSALYIVGTVGVTRACNIPRNDALAAVDPASAEGARVWATYLREWTNWNHVRTVAGLAAAAAFAIALCA
jgi:uncharacterized membrane protein